MRKKLCCILILMVLLLNSSIMIIISEAVDTIQTELEQEKIKVISEINLTKYENYDTTAGDSEWGSKGVLVQFNLKTGIEFAEEEEYQPIQKTETNMALPWIGNYRPSRVEVITKTTQATNGGKEAKYEYHSSTGILSIVAENSDYTEKVENARDEYEIICIYRSDCYAENEERNLSVKLNTYETLNKEEKKIISTKVEERYQCKETIGGIISEEHETEDIYDGYIKANQLNTENKYETIYNEKQKIMVSNKELAQKIEVRETSETALYSETSINKDQILDVLGEKGSINIVDEKANIIKTINKDSETDENGKIKFTYKDRISNLLIELNNVEKEGIIELENARVIEPTAEIIDNKVLTQIDIRGINTVTKEINNEKGEKTTESEEIVKYERKGQSNAKIKSAISEIEAKLSNDTLVNNIENNVVLTVALKTDESKYSLFKNPTISIEMPKEVKNVSLGTIEMMYDNKVFTILSSNISENEDGNKVINIRLQGEQTSYDQSTIVEGTNIRIPLTIGLIKQLESKKESIKLTYTNENTVTTENKEIEVSLLNKVVNAVSEITTTTTDNINNEEQIANTSVYEQNGIKAEIIQEVGNTVIGNDSTIYEQQIIKQSLKVTNNSNTSKKVSLIINVPDEMTYVKLQTGGYIYNEEKNYYKYSSQYEYKEQEEKSVKIELNVNAGETKTEFIELKVKDLPDDVQEKEVVTNNELKIDEESPIKLNVHNIIKQAEVKVTLTCFLGYSRKDWQYTLEVTNLTDRQLKNVKIVFKASEFFKIGKVSVINEDSYNNFEDNVWTYTIDTLDPVQVDEQGNYLKGQKSALIVGSVEDIDESKGCEYEINGIVTVSGDNISNYVSNMTRMTGYLESVEVNMNSDKDTLKMDDEITYTVQIKNTGKTWGGFAIYTNINVTDVIPRELKPISIKYNKFTINKEIVKEPMDGGNDEMQYESQTYKENIVTEDISTLVIPDGYDEEDAPNIDLDLAIPEGKTITLTIKAKARANIETKEITNTVKVEGEWIKTKSASVNTTILKYEDNQVDPDNPEKPDTPDAPDTPDEPNTPDNPATDNKISISGTAWIDENEDGKRTTDEKTYSNMTVMLYDYKNNTFIKENGENKKVQTDENGKYEFTELDKGQYIVVFLYNTDTYKLTEYQKDEVIDSKNNDAITKTIEIDGDAIVAGLTDTLTANENLINIDIGLIENKKFDLELQKYISKITVQTKDGKSKTYTYNDKQFAKVEINSKKINGATVVIEYRMVITNKGEVEGTVPQVIDKLPSGLSFKSELNNNWYEKDGILYTNSLSGKKLNEGESGEISLLLTKEVNSNNLGTIVNTASIGISSNNKAIEDMNKENDSSSAQVIIGVSTGILKLAGGIIGIISVLVLLVVIIWKNRKIMKNVLFLVVFGICLVVTSKKSFGWTAENWSFTGPDGITWTHDCYFKVQPSSTYTHPNKIKGHNMGTHGTGGDHWDDEFAEGDNGYRYHCGEKGKTFCDFFGHDVEYIGKDIKSTTVGDWSDWSGDAAQVKITNKTDNSKVKIESLNNKYSKLGPFRVNCSGKNVSYKIMVTYTNAAKSSVTLKCKAIDFKWGQDFYIEIPKEAVEVTKVEISASKDITRTRSYSKSVRYWYKCTAEAGDVWCVGKGELQNMYTMDPITETGTETDKKKINNSIDINGSWLSKGDVKIVKVDSKDTKKKLKNVEFIVYKGTDSNKCMTLYKNGKKLENIIGTKIDVENVYTVKFNSNVTNATRILTDDNGSITIKGMECGTYTFKEVSNSNYGYSKMLTETVNINNPKVIKTVTIKNEKKVGDLNIDKSDDKNTNKKLSNVEFVIMSSYNKKYIKVKATGNQVTNDNDGWATKIIGTATIVDMTYTANKEEATKFVTDSQGKMSAKDLLSSSNGSDEIKYNLIETYNPNPMYNADYKSGYVSLGTNTIQATNHQVYINLEGYVWEEIVISKDNSVNNIYNSTDALMEGIKVCLYKDGNLEETTTTDSDGKYRFEKIKIDDLDKYHVEFEYDGLRFTPVEADIDYSSSNYNITSKAAEEQSGRGDNKDRQSVNADFSEITNGKSRNNGKEVYTLEYDFSDNVSTYKDHWGYEYNGDKTKLKVTSSEDYTIIASTKTSGFNLKSAWKEQCEKEAKETLTGINLGVERREQSDLAISTDISSLNVMIQNYENTYTYEKRKDYEGQEEEKDGFGTEVKFGNKYGTSYSNRGLNMYTRRIYESDLAMYNENYANDSELMQIYVTYKIVVKNQSSGLTSIANELTNYYDSRYVITDSWIVNGNNTQQIGANGWSNTSKYGISYNENGYVAGYTKATSDIKIAPNEKIEVYIKFRLKPEAIKALIEKQTTLNNVTEISAFSTKMLSNNTWVPYASIDTDSNPGSVTSIKLDEDKTTKTTLNGREYEIENKTLNKEDYEDDTDIAPSLILGIEEAEPTRGLSGTVFEDEDALHNDDNTHTGEERLGDGILHTGGEYRGKGKYGKIDANRVKGAKVELLEYDENATDHIAKDENGNAKIATLYKLNVSESGEMSTVTEDAITNTDNKGEYLFTGVIPGRYLIRYTYGGDNCYITNSAGEQIEQINAIDYKSTIITSDILKVALNLNKKYSSENEREGDLNWILKYDSTPDNDNYTTDAKSKSKDFSSLIRYSGATDDLRKREETDDLYNGVYKNNFEMTSDTAFFDVGVEYSEVKELNGFANKISYTDYTDEYQLDGDKILVLDESGKIKIVDTFYAVNPYQDFGIIERARQEYDTNKRISNLKITLANGQVLINGNPYKQLPENTTNIEEYWKNLESASEDPLPYVKALRGQIIAEIDNEILQGATLNVEYTISIKNKAEIDYNYKDNKDYYYYGKNGKEKNNTVIRKIVDYMDDGIVYDEQQNSSIGWQKVQASDLYNWTKDEDNNNKQLISEDVEKAVEKGYTIAVTEYFYQAGHNIEPGSIGSVKIYGNKVLSTNEKGISVENHAEIIETIGIRFIKDCIPGNYNPNTRTPDEPDDDMTKLVITPPTGLKDNKIFLISAVVIVMSIFAGGVYFIKKKVLE